MKLLQLDIEGFHSLFKVTWKPGDLNVVMGPSASQRSLDGAELAERNPGSA